MSAGDTVQGRRVPDETPVHELEPGDYRREGERILWGCAPNGEIARVDRRWSIVEEPDGTITVGPLSEGGSSSILIHGPRGWHGYLEHGVWREV
jgi:hypothetical protein